MNEAFVIMQIGNPQLELLWKDVYYPAIKECGLEPKRVDKHNEGRLLQSEIANFINRAKIIIADLTNERQNCYLEVGYSMGIDKFKNLLLCARGDHNPDSPHYNKGGPKIHFDLSGYGFLWWEEADLQSFKTILVSRIKQRLKLLEDEKIPTTSIDQTTEEIWREEERSHALDELKKIKLSGFYEISFTLVKKSVKSSPVELLRIAEQAAVHTSGWPIGVVLHNEKRPKPGRDGIKTIISSDLLDYWILKNDGIFYFLRSYEEDRQAEPGKHIHLDTRIRRITEAILYCYKLYKGFNVPDEEEVAFWILHSGLKGRMLGASDPSRLIMDHWECAENEVDSSGTEKLSNLIPNIKDIVFKIANELFIMFDYFDLNRGVSDDIVDKFVSGKY
jgi:hypothetical protein